MKKVKLSLVAEYINGMAVKPEQWSNSGLPIIRIQNLNSPTANYNYFNGIADKRYLVSNGDLLVSWSASLDVYIWNGNNALLNQHIFKVNVFKNIIDKSYLYYIFKYVLSDIKDKIHGATMKHITKKDFENILIPYLEINEQRQIAQRIKLQFEKVEKAKFLAEKQLKDIDGYIDSIYNNIFESKEKKATIGDLCYEDKIIIKADSALPYLSMENINSYGHIDLTLSTNEGISSTYQFSDNHILYGKLRPYLNKVAMPNFNGRCTTELIPLLPKENVIKEFAWLVLRLQTTIDYVMQETTGSRMPRANMNHLFKKKVYLPNIATQKEIIADITTKTNKAREIKQNLQKQLQLLNAIPNAILKQAFSGE